MDAINIWRARLSVHVTIFFIFLIIYSLSPHWWKGKYYMTYFSFYYLSFATWSQWRSSKSLFDLASWAPLLRATFVNMMILQDYVMKVLLFLILWKNIWKAIKSIRAAVFVSKSLKTGQNCWPIEFSIQLKNTVTSVPGDSLP